MTYPKLRPCPCGAEPFLFGYEGWNGSISSWRVECDECGYIGSCEGRKLDAIREHNRRAGAHPPQTPTPADVAGSGAALKERLAHPQDELPPPGLAATGSHTDPNHPDQEV